MEERTYAPGFYWYNPWSTDVEVLNASQQKIELATAVYTKDAQQATVKATVTFRLDPSKAHIMYRRAGTADWANAIPIPAVIAEVIKNEFGRNNAMNVISQRAQVANNITIIAQQTLAKRGIVLDSFELVNVDYSDAFEEAVEAKEVAVQDAIREKNKTVAVQERANQAVISAKGQAESMRVRAQALESNPKLVEYEAVQKWNGELPNYMMGQSVPFINLNQ